MAVSYYIQFLTFPTQSRINWLLESVYTRTCHGVRLDLLIKVRILVRNGWHHRAVSNGEIGVQGVSHRILVSV